MEIKPNQTQPYLAIISTSLYPALGAIQVLHHSLEGVLPPPLADYFL